MIGWATQACRCCWRRHASARHLGEGGGRDVEALRHQLGPSTLPCVGSQCCYFLLWRFPTSYYGSRSSFLEVPPKSPACRYVRKRPRLTARSLLLSPSSHPLCTVCVSAPRRALNILPYTLGFYLQPHALLSHFRMISWLKARRQSNYCALW